MLFLAALFHIPSYTDSHTRANENIIMRESAKRLKHHLNRAETTTTTTAASTAHTAKDIDNVRIRRSARVHYYDVCVCARGFDGGVLWSGTRKRARARIRIRTRTHACRRFDRYPHFQRAYTHNTNTNAAHKHTHTQTCRRGALENETLLRDQGHGAREARYSNWQRGGVAAVRGTSTICCVRCSHFTSHD